MYLSEQPNTILRQSKYSCDCSKKNEYHSGSCGCDFHVLVIVDVLNGNLYETRETSIPDNHDPVSGTDCAFDGA
jgi:hypothetical protein